MNIRKSLLAAAALLAVSALPSFAAAGQYGLGYFRAAAPVGGRIWFTDKVALDAGFGIDYNKPDGGDSQTSYTFDAGVPFVVAESGSAKFFVRPGITYATSPSPVVADPDNKTTQFWVSGSFGVEYFFTDRFSVQAAHGLVYKSVDPDQAGTKSTSIQSEDFGISNIGFHFYFGGSK
ncbi:MAG: hypothetical protein ABL977_02215 [Candidatus Eisenbacteria bacterium]